MIITLIGATLSSLDSSKLLKESKMKPRGIHYKAGYKYQFTDDRFPVMLPVPPGDGILLYNRHTEVYPKDGQSEYIMVGPFLKIWPSGKIRILEGYAWDGPSGPAFDTPNFMTPSMVHDALYQLMRNKVLPLDPYREIADEMMYQMCRERGMCAPRAWWCKRGVRRFGKSSASKKRTIYTAP